MAEAAEVGSYVQIMHNSTDLLKKLNLHPIVKIESSFVGKIRARNVITGLEWGYLAASILVLSISLGITIERLTSTKPCECDFAFGLLLLLTIMFCYYYVIHSVLVERWDELFVFVASKGIVSGYCIVNYVNGDRDTLKLIRLILACSAGSLLIILGFYLCYKYHESNKFVQDAVGGNSFHQRSCRIYYVCSSLLKFDLQLQWSMLILVMGKSILDMSLTEKWVFGSGFPAIFLVFIFGRLGIYYENKRMMIAFYTFSLLERGYIIYTSYYTYVKGDNVGATYNPIFVCGISALVVWILLFLATGYFAKYRFGTGLKERFHVQSRNKRLKLEGANINGESRDGIGTSVEETI